jgi:hypothetical protein
MGRMMKLKYSWLLIVAFLFSQNVWSQVSAYTFSQTAGTYSAITGGTVVVTATGNTGVTSMDSYVSSSITIPFSFVFNGAVVSSSYMSSNGFLTLGTTAPSTFSTSPISGTATAVGNIAAWGGDINGVFNIGGNTSQMRYELQGTPGSQVMIYQWRHFRPSFTTSATNVFLFDFQIKLYEGTNKIEIVYGGNLAFAVGSAAISGTRQIGLRGSANTDFKNRTNATTLAFSSSTAGTLNSSTQAFNTSVLPNMPTSGLTYNWTAPNCLAPSAVVATAASTTSANFSWTAPGLAPGVGYEYFVSTTNTTPSTAANTGTATATTSGSASSLTPNTTYYVFVRSECTADTDYSSWSAATSFFTGYCASTSTGGTSFISSVTTTGGSTNISNASGGYSASGYGNFSAQSVTCQQSNSFTLNIQNNDDVAVRVFVDWNNDLDFADAGETVVTSPNYLESPYLYSPTITVNVAQPLGSYRMRIRTDWNSLTPVACGSVTRGETEDYTLVVTAAPSCTAPSVPVVSGVSNSAATLSWTAASSSPTNGYDLYVSTINTAPTGSETYTDVAGVSQALSSLTGNTTYYWWVRSDCGSSTFSTWLSGGSFTTECDATVAFPAAEPFTSYLPSTCWKEGLNGDLTAGPLTVGGDGVGPWTSDVFLNSGTNGAAKINMYTTPRNNWLISPSFTIPASPSHRMTVDVAALNWNATTAVTNWESDDYVEVLISTTALTNWTILETFNASNVPSNAGVSKNYDLTAYAGQTVRFAIRAVEGSTDGLADLDFMIDNFVIEESPSCLIPTALSAVGASTNTIDFQWTASASSPTGGYQWEARTSGAAGSGVSGLATSGSVGSGITAASATGLSANTTYSIYVRSNCGAGGFSAWTSALNVYTGYCTPAPTSVDGTGITNVTFSGVNNTTGAESGNYGDFTSLTGGSFAASTLATVNITYTTGYTYDTKIWVDWNNDLDFTDSGEEVYTGTSTSASPTTLVATFTIPAPTAVASYRMRIGGLDVGPATPCYTGTWGSFEDYTLVVTAAPSCLAPSAPAASSITPTGATLSWTAASPAPSNGYDLYVSTTNTAPTGSESFINVTGVSQAVSSLSANTTYYWWVRSDCGPSDYSTFLSGGSFTTPCATIASFPFNETFEAASSTRSCWATNDYVIGTVNWAYAAGATSVLTTSQEGLLNARFFSASYSGNTTRLVSPAMDLTSLTTPRVTFYYAIPDWLGDQDELRVYYKTSSAGSWTLITGAVFTTSTSSWTQATFTLPTPSSDYYLAFQAESNWGYGAVVDNVVVEETPSCLEPTAIVVSSITNNAASLSWTGSTSDPANGYEWEVRTSGTAGSGATGLTASGSTAYGVVTASATGLTASTTYNVYVRSNCGSFSAWIAASTFTTLCAPVTLPYTENFDPASTSRDCWIINDNNGDYEYDWSLGDIYTWAYYYDGVDVTDNFPGIYASATDNDDYLISPPIPLTGNEWVTYDVFSSVATGGTGYEVLLSTTGTSPGDFTTTLLAVTSPTNTSFEGMNIDLSAYSGTVYLAWYIPSGVNGDEYVFIDNVTVEPIPACIPPTGVSVTGLATNWTAAWSGASDVVIEYGPVGFTPGTGGTAGVNGTIVSGSGSSTSFVVPADASYEAYVRANCTASADGYSTNVGPFSFNSYVVVPYSGSQTITTCSATIYDHGATGNYLSNANGTLVIYPDSPSGILALNGTFTGIEGCCDDLDFFEGVGTGGLSLGNFNTSGTIAIIASAPNTPITVRFTSDSSVQGAGFQFTASCQEVCTDVPVSAALTGNASVCLNEGVNLSLVAPEVGLTYLWQRRVAPFGTWITIPGETGPTLNVTQTQETQYRARLGCVYFPNAGATVPTQVWTVTMNAYNVCYCQPTTSDNTGGDFLAAVVCGGINNVSGENASAYTNYTAAPGFTTSFLTNGQYSITSTTGTWTSLNYLAAWIDYNQNGVFEPSEKISQSGSLGASAPFTSNFTIPSTALAGTTRLRVREVYSATTTDPCTGSFGETEDYTVTIAPGSSNDVAANATLVSPPIYPACLNLSGNLALATDDPADASTSADLWYSFVAASNACRIAVSGGTVTNVEVELQNSSASNATTIVTENAQGASGSEILITDDLTVGAQYWVAIRNAGGVAGTFNVCIQTLSPSTCDNGPNFAGLCSSFKADWMGTSSYTATFTSQDVPGNVYTYTTTNSGWIPLSVVPATVGNVDAGGLQYGESYTVSVSANYNLPNAAGAMQSAVASPTSTCSISIAPVAGLNMATAYASVSSGSLATPGSNPRVQGSWIQTDFYVCGATSYNWSISEVNYLNGTTQAVPFTATTTSRQLRLWPTNIPTLAAGKRYQILVAPVFPWGTGAYNTATMRYVQIAGTAGMVEESNNEEVVLVDKSLQSGVFASLYPNPNNGENVNINIAGIESESVNIRIMDASGRTVWSNNFFVEGILATTVSFDRPLAAGVYMVEMTYNGEVSTQRMVVQK